MVKWEERIEPPSRPARRFAPESELPRALARPSASPDSTSLIVKGGGPPFHTFPPVMRAANRVRCRWFLAQWRLRRAPSRDAGEGTPTQVERAGRGAHRWTVRVVKWEERIEPPSRPARRFAPESELPRALARPSASPDSTSLIVKGGAPFHTFPPVMRAANRVRCRWFLAQWRLRRAPSRDAGEGTPTQVERAGRGAHRWTVRVVKWEERIEPPSRPARRFAPESELPRALARPSASPDSTSLIVKGGGPPFTLSPRSCGQRTEFAAVGFLLSGGCAVRLRGTQARERRPRLSGPGGGHIAGRFGWSSGRRELSPPPGPPGASRRNRNSLARWRALRRVPIRRH